MKKKFVIYFVIILSLIFIVLFFYIPFAILSQKIDVILGSMFGFVLLYFIVMNILWLNSLLPDTNKIIKNKIIKPKEVQLWFTVVEIFLIILWIIYRFLIKNLYI
jgi:hypothetical protein